MEMDKHLVVAVKDDPAAVARARRGGKGNQLDRVGVPLGMLGAQFIKTAMVLLFKLALNDGMPPFVLITYRSLIGAAVVAPMAVICERFLISCVNCTSGPSFFICHFLVFTLVMLLDCREMFKKTNLVALGWICISATMGYG